MKRFISILIILILILSAITSSFADVAKDETIYVNLDYNGKARDIKVVNRIYGESKEEYYIDYGEYKDIKPLVDIEPIVERDEVKWPLKNIRGQDIYYEANIDKELPIKVDIKYFLDGEEILGKDLAGKSGNLKIDILTENDSGLTTQIQVPLSLDVFSNIKVENGSVSVVGKTMTVVFTHLPVGDGQFSIEVTGKNIELESMLISSTNFKMPLSGDLEDFSSGIDQLARAFNELEDGSQKINKGTISLKDGIKALSNGIGEFYSGFSQINGKTNDMLKGFKQFSSGFKALKDGIVKLASGVGQLNSNLKTLVSNGNIIKEGLKQLNEGTTSLDGGLKEINSGLGQLNSNHKQLVQLAQSLQSSQDPSVKALAEGVIGEGVALEGLSKGLNESYKGVNAIAENSNKLYLGFSQYNDGLSEIYKGYNQIAEGLEPISGQLETMESGHSQLVEGLGSMFGGLNAMDGGIAEINNNTKNLPNNIGELADGQKELSEGISKINKEGIGKIKDAADVFAEITGDEEDSYVSFVDNRNKNNSTCQFVMKTPSIKVENVKSIAKVDEGVKKGFWQRFLDLFRK